MQNRYLLSDPIEYLKGVGPQRADLLKKELGLYTYQDLLFYYPYRYIDKTKVYHINEITPNNQYIQLQCKTGTFKNIGQGRGKRLLLQAYDATGSIELIWFKGIQWIPKTVKQETEYLIFGKPNFFNGKISMPHPEMELVDHSTIEKKVNIYPIYYTSELLKKKGVDAKAIAKFTRSLVEQIKPTDIIENLPDYILHKYHLISRYKALKYIHYAETDDQIEAAKRRLKFEELFFIQMKLLRLKVKRTIAFKGFVFQNLGDKFNNFYHNQLPFELTEAQKRVLKEIRTDLLSGKQMNRLLQGDVGSGKTIVALLTMLMALDNDFQACLMAPTEILAQQHFQAISELVQPLGISVALLTGSVKGKERKYLLEQLQNNEIGILIGTHALIENPVIFKNLGIAVIDEQHRFGVAQRAKLWKKNVSPPHVLVMTATPIPRTLAMTLYADLDVSIIDELPPGRKPIQTIHKYDSSRLRVFGFMKEQIAKGRQVYVVYPLIQESEKLDYKDLIDGHESITREFPLPKYKVSIVHGQMKSDAKEYEMNRFIKGETQIMVATTVIEVGVNVPNASVMIIESSERFGLSQLHQLRGRVGRGAEQSYCILMTGNKLSKEARERIKTMVRTNDGFEIAEVDMKLRGPGDMEGIQQSGVVDLKIADLVRDVTILQEARNNVLQILEEDPELKFPKNKPILDYLGQKSKHKVGWSKIS